MRSNKGVPLTPEHRAKIGEANRRAHADPERKAQVSARFRALWQDPEYRERWLAQRRSRPVQTDEERKAAQRAYYEQNKEKIKARAREWYAANQEYARQQAREYQRRNREAARARYAAWIAKPENRDKVNAASRAYLKAHPEHRQKYESVRRALRRGATVELVDRDVVLTRAGGLCGWCGDPVGPDFHVDHIVALVHGGEHSYANTQPVHPACNYEKRIVLKERAA